MIFGKEEQTLSEMEFEKTTIFDSLCKEDYMGLWLPKHVLKGISYKDLDILIVSSFQEEPVQTDFTKKIDEQGKTASVKYVLTK